MGKMNKNSSFLVEIKGEDNKTWQGKVTWLNKDKTEYFRSALELIKLIDSTMEADEPISFTEEA